ncbi:MAG TPA: TonB-dependent receptor [Flavipsychrobacter sp.]|nr:TonB-dependent receptor [Flavipsychrobacter sp.]
MRLLFTFLLLLVIHPVIAQRNVRGYVFSKSQPVPFASVVIGKANLGTTTDSAGFFQINNIPEGEMKLHVSALGFYSKTVGLKDEILSIELLENNHDMNEVVVTGTMKEISRSESPIPVEIITAKFFQKNPTPNLFEAVGLVNGVKPQLNCNVCNTGDIHINGMEGPYTMILIDGMPIVSSLSTVYGLSGIPNSIVERIEVVKGPASSLYGSEAMGGIINVITKNPSKAPLFTADIMATSWQEYNADIAVKASVGKAQSLLGISYFNYSNPTDNNDDGFTDITLQSRLSIFNKWNFSRQQNRIASIAARYVYEDRWGGQMNWNKQWRGTDSIYGESIYTQRVELIGMYQLPFKEKIISQWSYNWHNQDSYYGVIPYMATQQVAFAQLYWDKQFATQHNFLLGTSLRYNYYDDNTPATSSIGDATNQPSITTLPGIFAQEEWSFHPKHRLLAGYRYDYNEHHGNIHSPRLAYKWSPNKSNTLRASFGTGFRVVNLFTEDHAALTGAREVIIEEELNPERSYNGNLNYVLKTTFNSGFINFDLTAFYSYFTNKIVADFNSDPNKIIYNNLQGYGVSQGASLNVDANFTFPLKLMAGVTFMDVYQMEKNEWDLTEKNVQLYAPKWSGNFLLSYTFSKGWLVDVTGNWNGPMRLPVFPNDYRPEYSPWFCIANVQLTKKLDKGIEFYGGVKNIFNFVPANPIMRANDPFDKYANDPVNNPNGYTFDPSYNYASLQGMRVFLGVRYQLQK